FDFGASSGECVAGDDPITASAGSQGLEIGARQPNATGTNSLRRSRGERERDAAVITLAQRDVEPSFGQGCGSCRVFSDDGLDGCMNWFWICALCQIDRCSGHPCLRVQREEFERLIQKCSEISIMALEFITEGQLLEQKDVPRIQLKGALEIVGGFLPPPLSSINITS